MNKKSKSFEEVKPPKDINKNAQSFLGISPVQKEVFLHINSMTMHMSNRTLQN